MIFRFRCSIIMISTHNFTVTLTSLRCMWYVAKLFHNACLIFLQYQYRIIFLYSQKARGHHLDRFIGAGGTVSCQYDKLRCYQWRRDLSAWWPLHDDVIKWKHFPRYWPFVRGIHRSPVNSPHKGQWRGALMFSLICVWINDWVNSREAGDLRRNRAHYDVIVMVFSARLTWYLP